MRAVVAARRHWLNGALDIERVPYALKTGIEIYDAALNSVQVCDIRADRAEREREAKKPRPAAAPARRTGAR